MTSILIKNGLLINENEKFIADIFIEDNFIAEISKNGINRNSDKIIEAEGKWVMPRVIDDQVHFREPGLTHKAEIYTEAKAAVAGGTTSYMEMPNTNPQATTQKVLEKKYARANQCSLANYAFFMGGTNDNLEEVRALVNFCRKFPSKVNLIEYNPIGDDTFMQATKEAMSMYQNKLTAARIINTIRRSRGKDIDAACGQLANKALKN